MEKELNFQKTLLFTGVLIAIAFLVGGCNLIPGGNSPPQANFTASPREGEAPLEVGFDASASSDSDGDIVSYDWEFGDGSTGSGQSQNHTYKEGGDYEAVLSVTDDEGATSSSAKNIQVRKPNEEPVAKLSAEPIRGEAPLAVEFDLSESNDPDGSLVSYSLNVGFGDPLTGSDFDQLRSATYDSVGTYSAKVTVTDDGGATNQSDPIFISVREKEKVPPVAEIEAEPESGLAPLEVDFDASGSSDSDGNIISYEWDFGDGSTGSGEQVSHTFSGVDVEYDVVLTVTDDDGLTGKAQVTIELPGPPPPPG